MTRVSPARLLEARLRANHSQDSLARAVGTSARNIWRWENGKHAPRAEFVAAIAAATGQEIAFFFQDDTVNEEKAGEPDMDDLANSLRRYVQAETRRLHRDGVPERERR